ncbi:LOW QUALITY PROTEIN: TBC1 domain family member 25-like [Pollicipes pollicipes]|uniref:LOW QUALITY PROTEIN: TBC1 domain family member 25-like n=1 Tax=Pollicipes pollicipes TaxID=41117 RepID=UPI0018852993|nr:LOW QUALITY PROTEIN: TBC1 domain family member 25-like [Pollicipes pollicipes]
MSRDGSRTISTLGYPNREAVRIKVKKYEDDQEPEYRKFSVDPQITTYSILRCLLSRAFELKGEFAITYMAIDDFGEETFLALLSDWDLDAAFLSASDPYLNLRLEVRPFDVSGGWEPEAGLDLTQLRKPSAELRPLPAPGRLLGLGSVLNQVQNTFSLMSRALNMGDERASAPAAAPPLTDTEFHNYLDTVGRLVQPKELRVAIYRGGVVPTLRKVVWKHLLNIYPEGMTARERIEYVKQKSTEYRELRDCWMKMVQEGRSRRRSSMSTNMVKKDVLRTDRHLPFFAGGDDNINVVALFNILTTYALNHPSVGYCQGMSDLVSPVLYVLQNEAQAYVGFCGLMRRLKPNFDMDGLAMTVRFQHLTEALQFYDPEFFEYLKDRQADDLLFCYRWLLLELKREFAFDHALRMLEVLWSSLPPDCPAEGLQLFERRYTGTPPPDKVCAIRRQSSGTVSLGNSPLLKKEFSSSEAAVTGMAASKRTLRLGTAPAAGEAPDEAALSSVGYSTEPAPRALLPPPQELGGGNPFLIFLCLSLLQQHRDIILSRRLDYQEVAMLFDKMVRKHDVTRTLDQARKMFTDYLKRDWGVAMGDEVAGGADVGV